MKTSTIVCALLAGTLGFGSIASAQVRDPGNWLAPGVSREQISRDVTRQTQQEQQAQQREQRQAQTYQQRGERQAYEQRGERRDDRQRSYQQPRYIAQQPHYTYNQPRYTYEQPRYGYRQPARFYRGAYLPYEYRQQPYYVSNWQAYPGLYAPAYGQQWMNIDGEFLLVALATGLIANALIN